MSLFSKKDVPSLAEKKNAVDVWITLSDGRAPKSYFAEVAPIIKKFKLNTNMRFLEHFKSVSMKELQELHDTNTLQDYLGDLGLIGISFTDHFKVDKTISISFGNPVLEYNSKSDVLFLNGKDNDAFKRSSIDSFEIVQDGDTSQRFGILSAIGGAAITGGTIGLLAGFIMPAKKKVVTDLRVRIITTGTKSVHDVILISKATKVGSSDHKNATKALEKITEFLQNYLVNKANENPELVEAAQAQNITQEVSSMDELKKLAELRDLGIVTDEEFEAKKKELLGL